MFFWLISGNDVQLSTGKSNANSMNESVIYFYSLSLHTYNSTFLFLPTTFTILSNVVYVEKNTFMKMYDGKMKCDTV